MEGTFLIVFVGLCFCFILICVDCATYLYATTGIFVENKNVSEPVKKKTTNVAEPKKTNQNKKQVPYHREANNLLNTTKCIWK